MANSEHLAILEQGVEVWNRWRDKNELILADLSGANLHGANLNKANFRYTDLRDVDFSQASLVSSDLSGANLAHSNLSEANLFGALLRGAYCPKVNLCGAFLGQVNLDGAYLDEANLTKANLFQSSLRYTSLVNTKFAFANFEEAFIFGARCNGTDFTNSIFELTSIAGTNLDPAVGLEFINHRGPSHISIHTIFSLRFREKLPYSFLQGAGEPAELIDNLPSLFAKPFHFYSCFISHSTKDKLFCDRLFADLRAKNVRVWYFPEDAKWGRPIWEEIDRPISIYDKLVLVCSENSLHSASVWREVERALNREDREGKQVLFPIAIDNHLLSEQCQHQRKADVTAKVVGDFTGWKDHSLYQKAFDKLLAALQAE